MCTKLYKEGIDLQRCLKADAGALVDGAGIQTSIMERVEKALGVGAEKVNVVENEIEEIRLGIPAEIGKANIVHVKQIKMPDEWDIKGIISGETGLPTGGYAALKQATDIRKDNRHKRDRISQNFIEHQNTSYPEQ